jgi:hypothetical protein
MNIRLITLLSLAGPATPAFAGDPCDAVWHGLPDFDQRRSLGLDLEGVFHTGLPGNGVSHCAPASALNILAFISSNGSPAMLGGDRDWASASNYDFVTQQMLNLGNAMGTTVEDGTGYSGWRSAMQNWLDSRAPEQYVASIQGISGNTNPVNPNTIRNLIANGSVVSICYGRYAPDPLQPGVRFRDSGHCLTVRHVYDACTNNPEMSLRNPDNLSAMVTQSPFDLSTSSLTPMSGFFRTSEESPTVLSWNQVWRFADFSPNSSTLRLLDGAAWVTPIFGLDVAPSTSEDAGININRPVRLSNGINPTHTHTIPGAGNIKSLALSPTHTTCFLRTQGSRSTAPGIWSLNLADGSSRQLITTTSTHGALTTSRFGDLFFVDGSDLKKIPEDFSGTPTGPIPGCPLPAPAPSIAYDDTTDTVVVCCELATGGWQLGTIQADIDNPRPSFLPLPATLDISGTPTIIVDPAGGIWLHSSESRSIYKLAINIPTAAVQIREHILLSRNASSVQPTNAGSLLCTIDGTVQQFTRSATGGWNPATTSPLAGLPSGPLFTIATGRMGNNNALATHIRPGDNSDLPSNVECPADFNQDGGIDGSDIDAFFMAWEAGDAAADLNRDGGVDGTDVEAFFNKWEAGSCD